VLQQQADMGWMLKDLAVSVPQTRNIVVLSADGLRMAQYGTELPHSDGQMRLVVIEMTGGFFYLMAAGARAYLAVLADEGVDAGLMGARMRDLVARIGEHLSTGPRVDEQPA